MKALNILYRTGELVRISASEHDALRAVAELTARGDVARAWID